MNARTRQLLDFAKTENQDFEWYPTTKEILEVIKRDIRFNFSIYRDEKTKVSILDVGAGDGRSLQYLTDGNQYAIEKSTTLLNALPKSIFVLGTEFEQQTLIDKSVDVVFSNPPYSDFVNWSIKIINEAHAQIAYLVLPARWEKNESIQAAIKKRGVNYKIIGEFDFKNADRQARAKINIVQIGFSVHKKYYQDREHNRQASFKQWFDDNFKFSPGGFTISSKSKVEQELKDKSDLVESKGVIECMVDFYNRDLNQLLKTYQAIVDLSPGILKELGVNQSSVCNSLETKINGLKNIYWSSLFDYLNTITNRLCSSSRKELLNTLTRHTQVDFSVSNAHAIVIWVIKNANEYIDSQLIDLVEEMTDAANIFSYKSNLRTFGKENWRYTRYDINQGKADLGSYALEYRIVLHHIGGIYIPEWWQDANKNGLSSRACTFLNDILTVAHNLGFDISESPKAESFEWLSNKAQTFVYKDTNTNTIKTLMAVKAFKNGNLHIKFNQKFIMQLNVEFGRLKGWLKSADEVAEELQIEPKKAQALYDNKSKKLLAKDSGLIRLENLDAA